MSDNNSSNKGLMAILGVFAIAIVAALVTLSSQMDIKADKSSDEASMEMASSSSSMMEKEKLEVASEMINDEMNSSSDMVAEDVVEMSASNHAETEPASGVTMSLEEAIERSKDINPEGFTDDTIVATVSGKKLTHSDVLAFGQSMIGIDVSADVKMYSTVMQELINMEILKSDNSLASLSYDAAAKSKMEIQQAMFAFQYLVEQTVEVEMSEEKLKSIYEEYKVSVEKNKEVHARHILVEDESKAREIIAKLEDGDDFEVLAKENSTGPSASTGGDLGYFAKEAMVPEFSEAAFAIKKGSFGKDPVKTQFGWHIIKVEDKRSKEPASFAEISPSLKKQFEQDVAMRIKDEIMSRARITIDAPVKEADTEPAAGDEEAEEKVAE